MSFSINTNLASLQAQNYLTKSSQFQSQTINRVTSGLRIVNSGDDAAGLAVANGLRSDQAVLNQGIQNGNNATATLQTIDSGMNNISTLLDRARTLATESASGTFTGDRKTLNGEFQSVVSEITRQATSIGMNQGGQFAQSLNVFIGGGKGNTAAAASTNGSINLDLSHAAVDAQSLGLQGVQAKGNSAVDLSSSSATSVQNIVADATNKGSEASAGFTTFSFKGPGFSDGNAIDISVNLAGVTDTSTLASAMNSAIQSAGNGTTAAATAFKNANISASVVTDSNGAQHIAFSSSNASFNVHAGDRMANALLGNTTGAGSTTGADVTTNFAGGGTLGSFTTTAATQDTTIKLQFQGAGMTSPDQVTLNVHKGDTLGALMGNLTSAVSNDSALAKAGISLDSAASVAGGKLTFKSNSGQQFSVAAGGDVDNLLGMGTAQLGAYNAVQYSTATGTSYDNTTKTGTANFEFSFNGAASSNNSIAVDLSAGDATSGKVSGASVGTAGKVDTSSNVNLVVTIDGTKHTIDLSKNSNNSSTEGLSQVAADITSQLNGAGTATVNQAGQLTITSASKGAGSSVVIGQAASNDAAATLGLSVGAGATTTAGLSRTGGNIANYLNQQIASNSTLAAAGLQASFDSTTNKLTVSSSNNTNFQLNAFGSNKAAAVTSGNGVASSITGSALSGGTATIDETNKYLGLTIDGKSYNIVLATGSNIAGATIATDITNKLAAAGSTATASFASNKITITSGSIGDNSSVVVTNTNPNNAASLLGIPTGSTFTGTAATQATATTGSVDLGPGGSGTVTPTAGAKYLDLTVDGTHKVIDISGDLTGGKYDIAKIISDINGATNGFNATIASNDGNNHLVLTSTTTGSTSNVKIVTGGANDASADVGLIATNNFGAAATSGTYTASSVTGNVNITSSNNTLDLQVDSKDYTVTLAQGSSSMASIASQINAQVSTANATVDSNGHLVIASKSTGTSSKIMVGGNDAFDGATNLGINGLGGGSMTTDSTHNVLTFKIDGGAAQSITLASQATATASAFAADINSKLAAAGITGMTATTNGGGKLVLQSTVSGSGHSIQVVSGGTNDASGNLSLGTTAGVGTDANIGFGFKGSSFSGNTQGAAPTTSPDVMSGGAYQTDGMTFSALANGADNQTINVTATDANGSAHTTNVVLKNNSLGQPDSTTGASIDSAINAINNSLQQSGDASLQSVAAVKYNDNGTEKIKFTSANTKFNVTVGTTADHTGVGSQGSTAAAAIQGTGSTADISTVNGAQAAVNALATAVQNLGTAQAAVGKGENNLNYAISLATTETTNEAAAESQIRDANLAQEAANLSRAQILVQAGTAALAQANSAPQQLLSLLRG